MKKNINLLLCSAMVCGCLAGSGFSMNNTNLVKTGDGYEPNGTTIAGKVYPIFDPMVIDKSLDEMFSKNYGVPVYQSALRSAVRSYQNLNTYYNNALNDLKSSEFLHQGTINLLNQRINEYKNFSSESKNLFEKQINSQKEQIERLDRDKEDLSTQIKAKESTIMELNEKIEKLNDKIRTEELEEEKWKNTNENLKKENDTLKTDNELLKSQIAVKENTIEELNEKIREKTEKERGLNDQVKELNESVSKLTKKVQKRDLQIESLTKSEKPEDAEADIKKAQSLFTFCVTPGGTDTTLTPGTTGIPQPSKEGESDPALTPPSQDNNSLKAAPKEEGEANESNNSANPSESESSDDMASMKNGNINSDDILDQINKKLDQRNED